MQELVAVLALSGAGALLLLGKAGVAVVFALAVLAGWLGWRDGGPPKK